jgi:hypothetical protein
MPLNHRKLKKVYITPSTIKCGKLQPQNYKTGYSTPSLAAENICNDLQQVVKTDVMLSPGMTSLGIISVGRGRIPFHEPTIWKSIGPR